MKYIIFLLSITLCSAQCLQMDIMLVGDMSGSVNGQEYQVADAFDALVDRLELSEDGIRIGVITFNTKVFVLTPQTSNKGSIKLHIDTGIRNRKAEQTTNLDAALQTAFILLSGGERPDATKLIILVSDASPNMMEPTYRTASQIKSMPGYAIFGVLIQNSETSEDFMAMISTIYVKTNYESLVNTIKQMDICL